MRTIGRKDLAEMIDVAITKAYATAGQVVEHRSQHADVIDGPQRPPFELPS
jgi:hypothetical protein